jgi:hypothetical protein
MSSLKPRNNQPAPSVAAAWTALRDHLVQRARDLNDEVRRYPTPIARCDDQLPKLLEQRGDAMRVLRLANDVDAMALNATPVERLRGIARFLLASGKSDDDVGNALREGLERAVLASGESN